MRKETKVRYKEANSPLQIQILLILITFFAFAIFLLVFLIPSSKQHFEQQAPLRERNSITNNNTSKPYFRLPTTIHPLHYNLKLQLFLPYREGLNFNERNFSIHANVAIRIICMRTTDRIILNAKNLKFNENDIKVQNNRNESLALSTINRYQYEVDDIHIVEIVLMHELRSGNDYVVYIRYQGVINDVWIGGLYKTQYNINGQTRFSFFSRFIFKL